MSFNIEPDHDEHAECRREIERLRTAITMHQDKARGDYWVWQGDGEDHLESLVCPVLIRPEDLIAILKTAEAARAKGGEG